jgi:hypothetical protein
MLIRKQQKDYLLQLGFVNNRKGYNVVTVHVVIKVRDGMKISVENV